MESLEVVLSAVKLKLFAQNRGEWLLAVEGVLFGDEDVRSVVERMHDVLKEERLILTLRED